MITIPRISVALCVCTLLLVGTVQASGLSPEKWSVPDRERAEKQEAAGWTPSTSRSVTGKQGVISAIASPIAVQAGIEALRAGGNAADAAGTVTLTEVATQLGSVVSYAGTMTLVYYDAKTGRVISLNAGYKTYRGETDPKTIPTADMGPLNATFRSMLGPKMGEQKKTDMLLKGRETLVPGFMAGIEAMHKRFGRLPFASIFEPAIWYAEQGVTVNPPLAGCFTLRKPFLSRTPEGSQFLRQAGSEVPRKGDRFKQADLAKTLRGVARDGAEYMYSGPWAHEFVKIVQREGGKVTLDDLRDYRVVWSEPLSTDFAGHRVYTAGLPSQAAYHILPALNLAEELSLDRRPLYWKDPGVLCDLQRINNAINNAPHLDAAFSARLREKGIDASPAAQLTKAYARSVKPLLDPVPPPATNTPRHSNAVVVIDKEGNIAALTHTINSVIWGDTGIVVGGVPIPDSAGFQQERLATIKPGDRLPNEMLQTIVFTGDKPILATAAIGSSMIPETIKLVLCAAGQGRGLDEVQAAPALLSDFTPPPMEKAEKRLSISITSDGYRPEFLKELEAKGVKMNRLDASTASGLRGTVAAIKIDPTTGERSTTETAGVLLFGGAQ